MSTLPLGSILGLSWWQEKMCGCVCTKPGIEAMSFFHQSLENNNIFSWSKLASLTRKPVAIQNLGISWYLLLPLSSWKTTPPCLFLLGLATLAKLRRCSSSNFSTWSHCWCAWGRRKWGQHVQFWHGKWWESLAIVCSYEASSSINFISQTRMELHDKWNPTTNTCVQSCDYFSWIPKVTGWLLPLLTCLKAEIKTPTVDRDDFQGFRLSSAVNGSWKSSSKWKLSITLMAIWLRQFLHRLCLDLRRHQQYFFIAHGATHPYHDIIVCQ